MTKMLDCTDLVIGRGKSLIKPVSFSLDSGLIALIGRNGVGKSTLLRTLGGLLESMNGDVLIDGNLLSSMSALELSTKISFVFSELEIDPYLQVREVLALGRLPFTNYWGQLKEDDEKIIDYYLNALNLKKFSTRLLGTLSDGEKQKVMVARALVQKCPILFLDEPTSYLDIPSKIELLVTLKKMAIEEKRLIVFSTHDFELASKIVNSIWFMAKEELIMESLEDLVSSKLFKTEFESNEFSFDRENKTFKLN